MKLEKLSTGNPSLLINHVEVWVRPISGKEEGMIGPGYIVVW
jgi:hypothetical protein